MLVRVHPASLNDWELGLRHGPSLPISRAAPKPILGSDVAGQICDVQTQEGKGKWLRRQLLVTT